MSGGARRAATASLAPKPLLLGLTAGALVALSMPPWGWWPLSFAGVAVFELALGGTTRRLQRATTAFIFTFAWLMVAMAWMWFLTAPGYLLASAVFAAYHAIAATVAPAGRWSVIGRPLAHTLAEALRLSFPFGGVPLATLAIAQAGGPFLGIARVGGVIALSWFVFQTGVLLGRAVGGAVRWTAGRLPRPALDRRGFAGAATAGLLLCLSFVAPRGTGTGEHLTIAAVQGGGEQGTRAGDEPRRLVTERHLEATASIAGDEAPEGDPLDDDVLDLVLWPENVVDVAEFASSWAFEAIAAEAERLGLPIAVGVTEDVPGERRRFNNAQVVVTPGADGDPAAITDRYDKVRRVPFGEYVPLRGVLEALGAPVGQIGTDAVAGTTPAVLDVPLMAADRTGDGDASARVGVVISWEVFFGGRVREGVRHGAGVVLNPTNGASYTGTIVQTQQVASSRLRAVETGRWVVQAAPTGFSGFVTPDGGVIDRTAVSERAIVVNTVELRDGRTWYVALGDAPFIIALLVALAAIPLLPRLLASSTRVLNRARVPERSTGGRSELG